MSTRIFPLHVTVLLGTKKSRNLKCIVGKEYTCEYHKSSIQRQLSIDLLTLPYLNNNKVKEMPRTLLQDARHRHWFRSTGQLGNSSCNFDDRKVMDVLWLQASATVNSPP
ncbi:hypothetical protein STEG23_009942 [Scotinomys teguina]